MRTSLKTFKTNILNIFENLKKIFKDFWKNILIIFLKKIFGKFWKNIWTKSFYDISQSAAPSKHHISYGKSFKKFAGGVVVVCLIIVSLQVHSFENLTLNFEFLSSWTGPWLRPGTRPGAWQSFSLEQKYFCYKIFPVSD